MNCNCVRRVLVCIVAVSIAQSAARAAGATLDSDKVVYLLRQAKVVKADQPLNVVLSQKQALVLTARRAAETDKDVKIDAVLIAREIITGFPDSVNRVRITFEKSGGSADQVDVTTVEVKAYGTGAVDADQLLASLDLTPVDMASSASGSSSLRVSEGPLVERRLLLLSRIEALKAKGTSVKPFMDIFNNIEGETSKVGPDQLQKDIAYLADKLSDQEALVKEAKQKPVVAQGAMLASSSSAQTGQSLTPADINRRCLVLQQKIDRWKSQGREGTDQLTYSLAIIKMLANDPSQQAKALDAIEKLIGNQP